MVADSATFKPMPYVNIVIRNKGRGTHSEADGSFKINADRADTLLLSFVGYQTKQIALYDWEPGIILLSEMSFALDSVTITAKRFDNSFYKEIFTDQNNLLRKQNKKLPFYYSKGKKEKIKVRRLENENERVSIYTEFVIKNEELKNRLIKKHTLTEQEYQKLLEKFNEENYSVMYYLTAVELLTLIETFFDANARRLKVPH